MSGEEQDRSQARLDEDEIRLVAAATPLGLELRQARTRPFEAYRLASFEKADKMLTRLSGEVEGAKVDLFEYEWAQPGGRGPTTRGRRVALVLRHPSFEGEARCTRRSHDEPLGAKILASVQRVLLWLMFFWIVLPVWLIRRLRGQPPFPKSRSIGNRELENGFEILSSSADMAARALPPAMQTLAVEGAWKGPLEVRPGMVAVGLRDEVLEPAALERALDLARQVVRAYAPPTPMPAVPYRVATHADTADERADDAGPERASTRAR